LRGILRIPRLSRISPWLLLLRGIALGWISHRLSGVGPRWVGTLWRIGRLLSWWRIVSRLLRGIPTGSWRWVRAIGRLLLRRVSISWLRLRRILARIRGLRRIARDWLLATRNNVGKHEFHFSISASLQGVAVALGNLSPLLGRGAVDKNGNRKLQLAKQRVGFDRIEIVELEVKEVLLPIVRD